MIGGRVLDATAIHDLTINRTIYGAAFLAAANQEGIALAVPTTALMEAWAAATVEDMPFLELLLDAPLVLLDDLDSAYAAAAGILSQDSYAADQWQPAAAHTVAVAQARGWPVLTADPAPLRALDAGLPIDLLPDT